ncbi:MAG: hypothetical protein IJS15_04040 [Victivallales bacterium]|nr:hypothetical protein [Victivallales bacterium]
MKTVGKIIGVSVLVAFGITLIICLTTLGSDVGGDYLFGEDIPPFQMEAGRLPSESEYERKILEYRQSYSKYLSSINFKYMLIAMDEFWMNYPDSASANAWHVRCLYFRNRYLDESLVTIMPYMQEMTDAPDIPYVLFYIFENIYINRGEAQFHVSNRNWWEDSRIVTYKNSKEAFARLCTYWARRIPDSDDIPNGKNSKSVKEWAEKEYSDGECEHVWALFVSYVAEISLEYKKLKKLFHPSNEQWEQMIQGLRKSRETAKGERRRRIDKALKHWLEIGSPEEQELRSRQTTMKCDLDNMEKERKDYQRITLHLWNLDLHGAPMQSQIPNYRKLVRNCGRKEADLLDAYYAVFVSGRARDISPQIEQMDQRDERVLMLKYDCQCALLRPLNEIIPTLDAILMLNPKNESVRKTRELYFEKAANK